MVDVFVPSYEGWRGGSDIKLEVLCTRRRWWYSWNMWKGICCKRL